MRSRLAAILFSGAVLFCCTVPSAFASYTEINLSSFVNLGFQNSWFINGNEFTSIIGDTTGNQGTGIPFMVADTPDPTGNGGSNNFWYGLYGGPGNQLSGTPLSITIPVGLAATTVYTLTDNTFGRTQNGEYSITFTPTTGTALTDTYFGGIYTKDYNSNCATTGCAVTPNAQYWFVDADQSQWLQVVAWTLPSNFGTLDSLTMTQLDGTDGAIFAGLTVSTQNVPEPGSFALLGIGLMGLCLARFRSSIQSQALPVSTQSVSRLST